MGCVVTVALALSGALALPGCAMMPMRHKAAAAPRMPDKVVLFFHAWSADLTPDAKVIVDQAAAKIKATGPSTVAVAGYVYNDASPDENRRLSTQRVKAVQDALVADGIDPKLFLSLPIGAADDSMGQIGDRRVEIRLTY
jgi:outer membrane protein OmpA-like peptidoglycan-associated protein